MIGRWNCEYCACRTKKRKQFFFLELRRRVACHLINEKKNKVLRSGGKSWSKHTHTPQDSNKKLYNVPDTTIKWPNQRELRTLRAPRTADSQVLFHQPYNQINTRCGPTKKTVTSVFPELPCDRSDKSLKTFPEFLRDLFGSTKPTNWKSRQCPI